MEIITKSASQTQNFGKNFGASLKGGEVLALTGDLGSGKTTFIQGLAAGLGIKQRIISPTFIIMRNYLPRRKAGNNFYHVDLYRLEGNLGHELDNLGITDIWNKDNTIVAIEWAEKIRDLLPSSTIWINFEQIDDETRKITIKQ